MMIEELLVNLENTPSKNSKRLLVENFLRNTPSQEELMDLVNSEEVKYSAELQLILKRFFREMEYKEANANADSKYDWLLLLSLLGSVYSV